MKVLLIVEDDHDISRLVRFQFELDPDFEIDGAAVDVESAITAARADQPDLVALDHKLEGDVSGLDAAPRLKAVAPTSKIILFSASEELREPALDEPAVDAFLLKTDIRRLVPLARSILGLR